MIVVTSNERKDLTAEQRRADVAAIYAAFPDDPPIVLWQEIHWVVHHNDVRAATPAGNQHALSMSNNPVNVPSRYQIVEERSQVVLPDVDPDPTKGTGNDVERTLDILRLRDTLRPNMPDFYVVNTHFPAGNNWDNPTPTADEQQQRTRWLACWNAMDRELDRLLATGLTVIWGGDFNRKAMAAFTSDQKVAVGANAVDKLAVVQRSLLANLKATGTVATLSDHEARWAQWALVKAT